MSILSSLVATFVATVFILQETCIGPTLCCHYVSTSRFYTYISELLRFHWTIVELPKCQESHPVTLNGNITLIH